MISPRNPSHAIPDTMTSASYPPSPRPISSPYLLPAPLPAEPCRPTGRLKGTTPSCPLLAHSSCLLIHLVPSHRPISSAHTFRPLCASLRPMRLIHLIRSRPISSAHLPSRPASRSASRRASRLASSRLTARHASSFASSRLAARHASRSLLVHLIHLIGHHPHLIPTLHPMRRAASRRNGA